MAALVCAPAFALMSFAVARAVAYPIAWLRLRRTAVWRERPKSASSLELLADFVGHWVIFCVIFGFVVGIAVWVGTAFA